LSIFLSREENVKKGSVTICVSLLVGLLLTVCVGCKEEFGIHNISPATGVLGGGEPIEILGSGFNPNLGIAVYFGNSKASNVVVSSSKKLIVSTPSVGEPQVVDVRIATDDGKEYLLRRAFRYIEKSAMDIRDLGQRKSRREKQ
jgi:hypothetical protein